MENKRSQFEEKKELLTRIIAQNIEQGAVIAFSGGADSSLLLKLACKESKKKNIYGVTFHTTMHPGGELEVARSVAAEAGAIHEILSVDELAEAGIVNNPKERCYFCKKYLFSRLMDFAADKKIPVIMEGTNADDLMEYRPGIKAVRELGIKSPLMEAGLTKAEVRKMAGELGIATADRPSAPCLATRFPYGTILTRENMNRVEQGENYLKTLGLYNVRVRVYDNIVRLEVDAEAMNTVLEKRAEIIAALKALGYCYITLDLEGFRSGSMDR